MSLTLFLVQSNALPGRDEEFNYWYTHQHLADVTSMPGGIAAQRFAAEPSPFGDASYRYLALYEVIAPQRFTQLLDQYRNTPRMPISDALDPTTAAFFYDYREGEETHWTQKERRALYIEALSPEQSADVLALDTLRARMTPGSLPSGFASASYLKLADWQWRSGAASSHLVVYEIANLEIARNAARRWVAEAPGQPGHFYRSISDRVVGTPGDLIDDPHLAAASASVP